MTYRTSGTQSRSFVLLAPGGLADTNSSTNTTKHGFFGKQIPGSIYYRLMSEMQRLRGRIYLSEGAIQQKDLDARGRHIQKADKLSWHLLSIGDQGQVTGCTRFRRHTGMVSWNQLGVRRAPIADCREWGLRFRASINSELATARQAGFSYVEAGGWALAKEIRGTFMALKTVLATYAWSQLLGGALGVTTATERNHSADILRRLGGRSLSWDGADLPPYYDQTYGCKMEILRFDSREPNPKYASLLSELREQIACAPVICTPLASEDWHMRHLPQAQRLFEAEIAC